MAFCTPPRTENIDDMGITSVSRSGRVRKKPTKLADFESDDMYDIKLKKQKLQQQQQALQKLEEFERQEKNKRLSNQILQQKKVAIVPLAPLKNNFISNGRYNGKINGTREVERQTDNLRRVSLNSSRVQVKPMDLDEEDDEEDGVDEEDEEEEHQSLANNHNNSTLGADDEESEESDEEIDVDTTLNSTNESMGFQKLVPRAGSSKSLYMSEKFNRKIVIKNGKVINKSKTERKDKGKTRYTAYMLWKKTAREQLLKDHPNLDFSQTAKKLGQMWTHVPHLEKYNWTQRAKRLNLKSTQPNFKDQIKPFSNSFTSDQTDVSSYPNTPQNKPLNNFRTINLPQTPKPAPPVMQNSHRSSLTDAKPKVPSSCQKPALAATMTKPEKSITIDPCHEKYLGTGDFKVTNLEPLDVAAHLSLLGDSLVAIGEKLMKHDGKVAVSGGISLMLDSLLCAFVPLLCLTQQVPELRLPDPKILNKTLENVSYFMPGL